MDAVKRYWFWITLGVVFLAAVIVRLVVIGGIRGDIVHGMENVKKVGKKVEKLASKRSDLPNPSAESAYQDEIKRLEGQLEEVVATYQKDNASFDLFFSAQAGQRSETVPKPVEFKQYYNREVRGLIELLKQHPGIETGLKLVDGQLAAGAFQMKTELVGTGKILASEIPLVQKQFWLQVALTKALLAAEVKMVELENGKIIDEKKLPRAESVQASDGEKPQAKYKEGLYTKTYRVEKINTITVDKGARFDKKKRFRIFQVSIDVDVQASLVPYLIEQVLNYRETIVRVRDLQVSSVISGGGAVGAKVAKSGALDRYHEPPVKVVLDLYCLDLLSKEERESIKGLKSE